MIEDIASSTRLYPRREEFIERLSKRHEPYIEGNSIRVPTDIILPTYEVAVVSVEGGAKDQRYTVGDGGRILRSLDINNYQITPSIRRVIERVVRARGLRMSGNEIMTDPINWDVVVPYVSLVANVMRDALAAALTKAERSDRIMLRHRIREMLNKISGEANVTPDYKMQGATTDSYRFDFSVLTAKHKRFLLDTPIPDPSSIAATLLRQSDVRMLHLPDVQQVIAYDPVDRWPSSNLAQLQLANVPLINVNSLEGMLQH
ncbi:hypothetical protein [Gluconobacter wancherniae]|uniref:hypothetical protein n=1 Tax=Gluconobacter wancherniae TaxID=1307955 RepID=UPI001B8AD9CD|nr:hypothetical protein [Gluconobacter wancherniae]MBS1093860.1 hypothetical protein [Gluconobacter wancherniae]